MRGTAQTALALITMLGSAAWDEPTEFYVGRGVAIFDEKNGLDYCCPSLRIAAWRGF
jgi:hypothetical protein